MSTTGERRQPDPQPTDSQRFDMVSKRDMICPVCGGEILATVNVPHGWVNASGKVTSGSAEVLLCAQCDADDPVAGPIVVFFTVHEKLEPDQLEQFSRLLITWAEKAAIPKVDMEALRAEEEAWLRGEL